LAGDAALVEGLDEAARLFAAGRHAAAAQVYRRLERVAPQDIRPVYSLAVIDLQGGRLARAGERLARVVAQTPDHAMAWHNLGFIRQQQGDWAGAAQAYEAALSAQPAAQDTREGLAVALAIVGRIDDAVAQHRILSAEPQRRWQALARIAMLDARAVSDAELAAMQQALAANALDAGDGVAVQFALGEALDRRGQHEAAFEAFAAGNAQRRAALAASGALAAARAANAASAAAVMSRYTPERLRRAGKAAGVQPIFVVGFPRSGSSLVEQILSRHPQTQGFGEAAILSDLLAQAGDGDASLRQLPQAYAERLRARGWDGSRRPIDKTLENYVHLGAILTAFPQARVLHTMRDPLETGFSCFRQLFAQGNETLFDLADIAEEYGRYRALMAHWRAAAPGRIVDVLHERLVADPEREMPALLAAAGLSWDPAVTRFFESDNPMRTASAAQVRRPLEVMGGGRAGPYLAHLEPLRAGLAKSV
jgi:tetratricopeptide (TPR) repeat protein